MLCHMHSDMLLYHGTRSPKLLVTI